MPISKVKQDKISVHVRIPADWISSVDELVKKYGFTSRSDLLRELLRKELIKEGLLGGSK